MRRAAAAAAGSAAGARLASSTYLAMLASPLRRCAATHTVMPAGASRTHPAAFLIPLRLVSAPAGPMYVPDGVERRARRPGPGAWVCADQQVVRAFCARTPAAPAAPALIALISHQLQMRVVQEAARLRGMHGPPGAHLDYAGGRMRTWSDGVPHYHLGTLERELQAQLRTHLEAAGIGGGALPRGGTTALGVALWRLASWIDADST